MFRLGRFSFVVILLAVIILSPALIAQAQTTNCFSLSAADCKILTAAEANLGQLTSFKYDLDLNANYNAAGQSGTVRITGSGLFDGNLADLGSSNDITMVNNIKLTLDMTSAITNVSRTGSTRENAKSSVILVDGTLYSKNDKSDEWEQFLLSDAADQFNSGLDRASNGAEAREFIEDPAVSKALSRIPQVKGFIKLQKTGSAPALEGQRQIEFVYTYDVKTLVKSREMYPVIRGLMKTGGADITRFSDQQMAVLAQSLANTLNGTTLKITRWVGSKDSLYHAYILDFAFRYSGDAQTPPVNASLKFSVKLTKIGQAVDIQAPK